MIEVEKKFSLSPEDEQRLLQGAQFIREKIFTDIYYDSADYALTKKDTWLRERSGMFELKVPFRLERSTTRTIDQYRELVTEAEIKSFLKISDAKPLKEALPALGFHPFCKIETTRRVFKKEGFEIDIDAMDFGYAIAEIELESPSEEQMPATTEKILTFARRHGLNINYVRGKVIEFLRRNNPAHLQALIDAGVV